MRSSANGAESYQISENLDAPGIDFETWEFADARLMI
jgi:hypothetical protein